MNAIIVIGSTAKEIAALAPEVQGRQGTDEAARASDRELLIREYERRMALLKSGASPGDVIFQV